MKRFIRPFGFACVIAFLCSASGYGVAMPLPIGQSGQGINIFNPQRNPTPPVRGTQQPRPAELDPVTEGLRRAGDPEIRIQEQGRVFVTLVAFLILVGGGIGGYYYWKHLKKKQIDWELKDPRALVHALNMAHRLSEQEKKLMQELAQDNGLPTPLMLFIEPKFLLEALEGDSSVSARPTVEQLLAKLFDFDDALLTLAVPISKMGVPQ